MFLEIADRICVPRNHSGGIVEWVARAVGLYHISYLLFTSRGHPALTFPRAHMERLLFRVWLLAPWLAHLEKLQRISHVDTLLSAIAKLSYWLNGSYLRTGLTALESRCGIEAGLFT